MRVSRFLFSLATLFVLAIPGAWAQTGLTNTSQSLQILSSGTFTSGQYFYAGGDTFTISGCSAASNYYVNSNCTGYTAPSTTVYDMTGSIFRGVVTLTLTCASGCTDSSLVRRTGGGTGDLAITVTIGTKSGGTYQLINEVATTANGANTGGATNVNGTFTMGGTQNFTSPLTDSITSTTTTASNSSTPSPATNSSGWTITETANMNAGVGTSANITSLVMTFYKTPEPATIAMLLSGLIGMAGARRVTRRSNAAVRA